MNSIEAKNFLLKLKYIKNHNYIISLKAKNELKERKNKENYVNYKKIIKMNGEKFEKILNEKECKIKDLSEKNKELTMQNLELLEQVKSYNKQINQIPNFLLRLFCKR